MMHTDVGRDPFTTMQANQRDDTAQLTTTTRIQAYTKCISQRPDFTVP